VVTGAARGIGRAIALGLAAEGASVACLDLDGAGAASTAEEAAAKHGSAASSHVVDLADGAAVSACLAAVVEAIGTVDILVVAAGGAAGERVPFLQMSVEQWENMQRRNLTSAFVSCSVFGRHLAEQGRGSIVLISSTAASVVTAELAHYSAAKGGVAQLMRAMALELAPMGVRVNAVAPGVTVTPGNAHVLEQLPPDNPLLTRTPLGRYAEPAEVVGAVVYLASDEASFTTGATIAVDGGYTAT
jgi:NAD(P)-dependent dehydrogenase (short-subunit alcohol dehydrogenase family)